MEELLDQIDKAHRHNLYYLSLFTALSIPDICGALEAEDGRANGERYRDWYRRFVEPKYDMLSAAEAYDYRCSALHQGKSEPQGVTSKDYDRVMFYEPAATRGSVNIKRIVTRDGTAIMIDLNRLVGSIVIGAREFLWVESDRDPVKRNLSSFMRRYPNGLAPWAGGAPIIS